MPGVRKRGKEIRDFILSNITENRSIAALTSDRFGISLTAVYKHIDRLVSEKQVIKKAGRYVLQSKQYKYFYKNDGILSEDTIWEKDIKKHFTGYPQNVLRIWIYGFLEIFNNAIEHSSGKKIRVAINENRIFTTLSVAADGIGIFKNIKTKFKLADEKDALLELFREVILDFREIEYIGQAFADEIFRVFPNMNPNTSIKAQNANPEVQNMIHRAINTAAPKAPGTPL